MKSKIKIIIGAIIAIALLVVCYGIVKIGGAEITEGKYMICDFDSYPDAYIEVKENMIQFYNIDLNAIYQEYQLSNYKKMVDSGFQSAMSDEQVAKDADLNEMFVNNGYEIDYETDDSKQGTFTYVYFCMSSDNLFGLVLEYDSLHKTIQINSPVMNLIFEK